MTTSKSRGYNFGAGPAALPESILQEVQEELLNWQNSGMSILETGHRTPAFKNLLAEAEQDLRDLLKIPAEYHVLFLGGPARTQFALIPMNILPEGQKGGYLVSGTWSSLAYQEAAKISKAYCLASSETEGFIDYPQSAQCSLEENTTYLYFTPNETINGVRFAEVPAAGEIPVIADMTSCLLTEPVIISDYGLIFAGAQKNIAGAGLTVVIVRKDILERTEPLLPTMLNYRTHAASHSLYATPPVFNCYLAAKMFKWIKAEGGVDALYQRNCVKATKLYHYIDTSPFYHCAVKKPARSLVNICFSLREKNREPQFLKQAQERNLLALKGHQTVGGLRASLYNAMPMAGVDSLIEFMREFAEENH